uniref:Uncharacterized protein n=1 Tax=Rhizophora mucronata TaxID=61149 RepID=A0A2P2Q0F8_RHIMU
MLLFYSKLPYCPPTLTKMILIFFFPTKRSKSKL